MMSALTLVKLSYFVAATLFLLGLQRMASPATARSGIQWAGLGMVLWLGGCTAGALAWLFHRSGILEAGLATVLAHVSQLPSEARTLFMLPYAMTAYVMWRAKETGLRCAIRPAP